MPHLCLGRRDIMLIKEHEFERIVKSEDNRKLAESYYKAGTFDRFSVEYDASKEWIIVNAIFKARYYRNRIMIQIDNFNEVVKIQCDCPYCMANNGCAHVGAVLLKIISLPENTEIPYSELEDKQQEKFMLLQQQRTQMERMKEIQKSEENALQLIQRYQQQFDQSAQFLIQGNQIMLRSELEIVYDYFRSRLLVVSFKLGTNRMYMIKDIAQFLERLVQKEYFSYGKNLAFTHEMTAFEQNAQKMIDFMRRYPNNTATMVNSAKYILLTEENFDDYYEVFSALPYECTGIIFKEEQADLILTAQKEHQQQHTIWKIAQEGIIDFQYLGSYHAYRLEAGCLTRYTFDEQGKCLELIRQFRAQQQLIVSEERISDFYKYVLSDIHEHVLIEGLEEALLPKEETAIRLYGDLDETGEICLTLLVDYGYEKGYGFDQNNKRRSLTLERVEKILAAYAERIDYDLHQVYFSSNSERAYQFAQETLPLLAQWCEIYVSDALKSLGNVRRIEVKVGISLNEELLRIDVDSVDMDRDEIFDVLRSYHRKKKFHRLKNGQLLTLESKELEELNQLVEKLGVAPSSLSGHQLELPAYRAFTMDQLTETMKTIEFERKRPFEKFIADFQNHQKETMKIPAHYQTVLRDYQKEGVHWLKQISAYGFGGILADDMGLGKTLQMIVYLESEKRENRTSLVVCPSSLLLNWQDEINKFSDELTCICIMGSAQSRKRQIEQLKEVDVAIISYDYLRRDIEELKNFSFFCVILDEAQYIKNQKTKNALSVKKLQAEHRFALTGTPIENSLAELWSIFDFLMPNYLYPYHYFLNHFEKQIVKEQDEAVQKQLKCLVEPFILRRNKKEVLKELPEKIENTYTISFDEEERKLYLANLLQVNQELQSKMQINQTDRIAILAMLTRLRQICCEPRMLYDNIHTESSKLRGCLELIQALTLSNHKILLFSSFTSALDLIAEQLDLLSISYRMLTGKTDKETRRERVAEFQDGKVQVFLISLKAGGTGLNLTAAEAVIHYDPWWNISAQNQATDRAYRIGQNNNVQVFKLIMKDSIEEKILQLQMKKKNLADSFVEESQGSITTMSMNEIVDLLKL